MSSSWRFALLIAVCSALASCGTTRDAGPANEPSSDTAAPSHVTEPEPRDEPPEATGPTASTQASGPAENSIDAGIEFMYLLHLNEFAAEELDTALSDTMATIGRRLRKAGFTRFELKALERGAFSLRTPLLTDSQSEDVKGLVGRAGKLTFYLVSMEPEHQQSPVVRQLELEEARWRKRWQDQQRAKALNEASAGGHAVPPIEPLAYRVVHGQNGHGVVVSNAPDEHLAARFSNVVVGESEKGEPSVHFELMPDCAKTFAEITSHSIGRPMAAVVDGVILMQAVVRSEIGARGQISCGMSRSECKEIVAALSEHLGAVPELISEHHFHR